MHSSKLIWLVYFIFVYITACRGNFVKPKPAANVNEPQQIHIGFGQRLTDIIILWSTKNNDSSVAEYYTGNTNSKVVQKYIDYTTRTVYYNPCLPLN